VGSRRTKLRITRTKTSVSSRARSYQPLRMRLSRERVGRAPHRPMQASRGWTSRACCAGCCKEATGHAEGVHAGHVTRWAPWTSRANHAGEPRGQAAKPDVAALHARSTRAGADREREGTARDAGIALDSTVELRPPWPSRGQASCVVVPCRAMGRAEPRAGRSCCRARAARKAGAGLRGRERELGLHLVPK
jgi:hypothetical protein